MPEVNYIWDPIEDNVIRETDESGNVLVDYTTEPTLYGPVISQDRGGQVRHYHYDGLGNTTELTDENGNVTDTRKYSAFGEVTESSGATEFPFQFGGRWGYLYNESDATWSIRRRFLRSSIGRWLSDDPISPTRNYKFVNNATIVAVDPSGLRLIPAFVSHANTVALPPVIFNGCGESQLVRQFTLTLSGIAEFNMDVIFVQHFQTLQHWEWCDDLPCHGCLPTDRGFCRFNMLEVFRGLGIAAGSPPGTYTGPVDYWTTPPRGHGNCASRGSIRTSGKMRAYIFAEQDDIYDPEIPGVPFSPPYVQNSQPVCGKISVNRNTNQILTVNLEHYPLPAEKLPTWMDPPYLFAGRSHLTMKWDCCPTIGDPIKSRIAVVEGSSVL